MIIDTKWRILKESETLVLQFHEMREKVKKDGTKEMYEFTENYFYATINQCLKAYLNKSLEDAKDVKDCVALIESTYSKIEKIILS